MNRNKIHTKIDSPVGRILLISDGDFLSGLYFYKESNGFGFLAGDYGKEKNDLAIFYKTARQLKQYFAGELKVFDIPVKLNGTSFQERVWNELFTIPYGETVSY
ncbi:MAG: cysteine methyltransferase, partial [Bacteroidota bacterium]